ncbi:Na+/H+ antiporter subunit E [Geodermatophilus sp. YIM 151500]|uniref:Na+/H+ antiporter subunit E n=1 Tax=Geodermatophilus sp. YIM 151500 TaxID=2984531 RepID=UPI0021E46A95|nr:Na+/H+ antiporter subunit E [Geodermatophilus sp. YIM 151500]MCV2491058.1 Na+/H+ antiporter subunit E [Geodermatophilus sp. YIM 151500]
MSERIRRLVHELPVLGYLVVVWVLLWGTWSWANLLAGAAVALVVTHALPLPQVEQHARFRPWAVLRLTVVFLGELARSSAEVAWEAVRPGGGRSTALIVVQLRTDSDLLLSLVVEALTLTPGSIVLDLDREDRIIAVHMLPVRNHDDLERRRRGVLQFEDRIVRAFGRADDIAALDRLPDPAGIGRPPDATGGADAIDEQRGGRR